MSISTRGRDVPELAWASTARWRVASSITPCSTNRSASAFAIADPPSGARARELPLSVMSDASPPSFSPACSSDDHAAAFFERRLAHQDLGQPVVAQRAHALACLL